MEVLFVSAFFLGLVFNAAPGAVFAETVREGVRGGFSPALAVQLGSLVGDALWAVLGLAGVGLLLQLQYLQLPIGIVGVLYLLWLGYDSWSAASREFKVSYGKNQTQSRSALKRGILLSVTNPQNVAYWAALGSAMGALGVAEPLAVDYLIFFLGFMASSVAWSFFCAAAIDKLFRGLGEKWISITYKLCAIAFLVLALNAARYLVDIRNNKAPDPIQGSQSFKNTYYFR